MLIKIGYDITLRLFAPTAVICLLRVHRSRLAYVPDAVQHDIQELPVETLTFLLPSRYCEVDSEELVRFAWKTFGDTASGWDRVQAICDFVHAHLSFDYQQARADRTALDAFRERVGVCRDFTHLAVTLCRCMNIPARYVTGFLGDIGIPPAPYPMDFSAWFEVYIGNHWHTFDARHNCRRIGRVLIARGRDGADVAITMTFAQSSLRSFNVVTEELDPGAVCDETNIITRFSEKDRRAVFTINVAR
jgi:transglutaminase-like putative cysteine protease